jgi:hypothetical protein
MGGVMSQTETLLLFVLGFCVALFVVLLFGRGVWSLIGGWSGWREQRRQPAAMRELQADRDTLKAEKAMMAQKLEASITDMKMRMAEQMAEVSRSRNRLLDLGTTLKERESTIAHLQSQLDDRTAQVSSLQSQIEENVKSINLAYAKMAQREDDHLKMQNVLKDAQSTLMLRDEKIRTLHDESKLLRDHATVTDITPIPDRSFKQNNARDAMFAALPPDFTNSPRNPLLASPAPEDEPLFTVDENSYRESETVERGVSNVLSLAERVRSLQSGMKKA